MRVEDKIARIQRISVRIASLALLLVALTAVLLYGLFELVKFVTYLINSRF